MTQPLFVAVDGPKGVGKTTLLEAVAQALRADGHTVVRLSERNHDPHRAATMALVNALARTPCAELEWQVCERLADSRAWISQHVLPKQPPGSLILMDRWYASDAAFRHNVPYADVLHLNLTRGVKVPDLQIGVTTAPQVSWARAATRRRGLRSTVVLDFDAHAACTAAFERAMAEHGGWLCRNEGTLAWATAEVAAAIGRLLGVRH